MPLKLSSPVTDIPRIGPAKADYLSKLNITHARDFLFSFPRRYHDFSKVTPIDQLVDGENMTIFGRVKSVKVNTGFRRGRGRLLRIHADIEDGTGVINVTWFNLRFLEKQLWVGRHIAIAGKIEANPKYQESLELKTKTDKGSASTNYTFQTKHRLRSPVIEFPDQSGDSTHTGRITPVYPETFGVTSRFLRYQVKYLLPLVKLVPEYLPESIRRHQKLIGIHEAIKTIHFPESPEQLEQAQDRLRFDELFFLQLASLVRRQNREQEKAPSVKTTAQKYANFIKKLPFTLTSDQQSAAKDIRDDMAKTIPMNRLLQGDVGAGKSAIAMIATNIALSKEFKIMYLAPTEILAHQQAASFRQAFGDKYVDLLIGGTTAKDRRTTQERLLENAPLCIVGTHALLNDNLDVNRLGLVIVDEQHRFGVKQRQALQKKNQDLMPHLLSMTATPIPRTLNLTLYGDLETSTLKELPPGRQPVSTSIIPPDQQISAIQAIATELKQGRQAYVITPLVEQSLTLQVKSAKQSFEEMKRHFPGVAIELLHGKMTPEEKEAILENFTAGAIQMLVATSVVEVGVNVPNATSMIIEGAERFGLAQLHQMRGRIGRGEHKSHCYLFPTEESGVNNERLQALAATIDGFEIAEADLKLRGPGEVYGTTQSGFGDLKVASLLDYETIKSARAEAEMLLQKDPDLKNHDLLRKKVEQKNLIAHFE